MQQDLDGGEAAARNPEESQSIEQLCSDPEKTRDRADVGEKNVPCHRCLAFDPAYRRSCLFLEKPPSRVTTSPPSHVTQLQLPTGGTIRGDDEV